MTAVGAIENFAKDPNEAAMREVVRAFSANECSDQDILHLAKTLASSGDCLVLPSEWPTADVASTGGPSSLTTLLCPLYLAAGNLFVPKLGIQGRPAGGIDVLAQIPGYRIALSDKEILEALEACRYAHFVADKSRTPLDARLFKFRQAIGTQQVPTLVIASLLAKKIAVSVRYAGLDVRVAPHGNFGRTWAEAKANASRFCAVGRLAGLKAKCWITEGAKPYQPYIGRGEALVALKEILGGSATGSLKAHGDICKSMAMNIAIEHGTSMAGHDAAALKIFTANLEAQGTTFDAFAEYAAKIEGAHTETIAASRPGFVQVDLSAVRDILGSLQANSAGKFLDPTGVILKCESGTFVESGTVLATYRVPEKCAEELRSVLARAIHAGDELSIPGVIEVING